MKNLQYHCKYKFSDINKNNRKVKMKTKNAKKKSISLRLTEELFDELSFKSELLHISNSDFLRRAVINTAISAKLDTKELTSLISTLNKISQDISQISEVLNVSNLEDSLLDVDYENLLNQLILMREQLRELSCM